MPSNYYKLKPIGKILLIFLSFPALAAQPIFGPGEPANISDLPAGKFRAAIENLEPQARGKALSTLQRNTVPAIDLQFMRVHPRGYIFFEDPIWEADTGTEEASTAPPAEISAIDVFKLHSKPGASTILYLDMDGHDVANTIWNTERDFGTSGIIPAKAVHLMRPFSNDSDYNNFNQSELDVIADTWRRMAEDFAPFDIDVTTEQPASFGANVGHILVTQKVDADGDDIYLCNCGGVAYYNGYGSNYLSPGLVFINSNSHDISEAASHEFGHNLNLNHDATSSVGYYSGHGGGAVSWGPIMGVGYYTNVTQWSKGEYSDANNTQDDLAIIASELSYRSDDHEDILFEKATPLVIVNDTDIDSLGRVTDPSWSLAENKGVIEDHSDLDLFTLDIGAGTINLTVTPAHYEIYPSYQKHRGSNLDIQLRLLNAQGEVIQSSNPDGETNANIYYNVVTPGNFYLEVSGTGRGDRLGDGYTDYASIGQYHLQGTVPTPVISSAKPTAPSEVIANLVDDVNIELSWIDPASTIETNEAGYRVKRSSDGVDFGEIVTLPRDSTYYRDNNLANGDYIYRLELYNSSGTTPSIETESININAPIVAVATSENTTSGSILSGSYINTQTLAGSETLSEQQSGGKPRNRISYLDHSWFVTDVVPGSTMKFFLSATAPSNTDSDDFIFTYSINGGSSNPIGTVINASGKQDFTLSLDPTVSGTIEINVVDSNQTVGLRNKDTIIIHELSITSAGDTQEQAPVVTITTPEDGITILNSEVISFIASAYDYEDGNLADISWNSDISGLLGNGSSIDTTLSLDTHVITASVTDSAGNTSSSSITVSVVDTPTSNEISISDLDAIATSTGKGKWQATITVTVLDNLGQPVSDSVVNGSWSEGTSGSGSCTTDRNGSCDITKGGLKNNVLSVTFSVTGISKTLMTYVTGSNSDADGDSNGTSISVSP